MSASTAAPFGEHFAHDAFDCEIHMGGTANDRFCAPDRTALEPVVHRHRLIIYSKIRTGPWRCGCDKSKRALSAAERLE